MLYRIVLSLFIYSIFAVYASAATAPGTIVTNTATVTYKNAAGVTSTAISNTVSITISAVNSVSVLGNNPQFLPAKSTVIVYFTVTNNGNTNDSFTLTTAIAPVGGAIAANATLGSIYTVPSNTIGGASGVVTPKTGILAPGSSAVIAVAVTSTAAIAAGAQYDISLTATSTNTTVANSVANGNSAAIPIGSPASATGTDRVTGANYTLSIVKTIQNITQGGAVSTGTIAAAIGDVLEFTDTITNTPNGTPPTPIDNVDIESTVFNLAGASVSLVPLTAVGPFSTLTAPSASVTPANVSVTGIAGAITLAQPAPNNVLSVKLLPPAYPTDIAIYVNAGATANVPGRLNVGDSVVIRYRVYVH